MTRMVLAILCLYPRYRRHPRSKILSDIMSENKSNNGVLVSVDGVGKVFHRGSEDIHVLAGLNLQVPAGEFLALMGPSGSGKSTLLNLIGGLDHPTEGSVSIAGEKIDQFSDRRL